MGMRIISACAEQTAARTSRPCWTGDHLRVCGADRLLPLAHRQVVRIISACAEQTETDAIEPSNMRDHLRVCGADLKAAAMASKKKGSSPRVRSRQRVVPRMHQPPGIISACAEQTDWLDSSMNLPRDHLRVCGADLGNACDAFNPYGSSPRVRSRHILAYYAIIGAGIISACAEQTDQSEKRLTCSSDHLRVCGADIDTDETVDVVPGSSPRVRSRQSIIFGDNRCPGIISACAEQTHGLHSRRTQMGDHLRVCGADTIMSSSQLKNEGSSPRVRSRPA